MVMDGLWLVRLTIERRVISSYGTPLTLNKKSPCSPEGTRTENTFLRYHLVCRIIRPLCPVPTHRLPVNAGNASEDTKGSTLFPLPSAAHLLPRFSLRSQLPELSVDALNSFTPASMVSISGYALYTTEVYVCQELFCVCGGQAQYSRTTALTMPMISA